MAVIRGCGRRAGRLPRCGDAARVESYVRSRLAADLARPASSWSRPRPSSITPRLRRAVRPGRLRLRQLRARAGCGRRSSTVEASPACPAATGLPDRRSRPISLDGRAGRAHRARGEPAGRGAACRSSPASSPSEAVGSRLTGRAAVARPARAPAVVAALPGQLWQSSAVAMSDTLADRAGDGGGVGSLPVRPDGPAARGCSRRPRLTGLRDRHALGLSASWRSRSGWSALVGVRTVVARSIGGAVVQRSSARCCVGAVVLAPVDAADGPGGRSTGPPCPSRPTSAPTAGIRSTPCAAPSRRPTVAWPTTCRAGSFYLRPAGRCRTGSGRSACSRVWGAAWVVRRGARSRRERPAGRLAARGPRLPGRVAVPEHRASSWPRCRRVAILIAVGLWRLAVGRRCPDPCASAGGPAVAGGSTAGGRLARRGRRSGGADTPTRSSIARPRDLAAIRQSRGAWCRSAPGSSRSGPTGVFVYDGVPDVVELFYLDPGRGRRPPGRWPAELPRHRPRCHRRAMGWTRPGLTVDAIRSSRGLGRSPMPAPGPSTGSGRRAEPARPVSRRRYRRAPGAPAPGGSGRARH